MSKNKEFLLYCDICDYKCSRVYNLERHLLTTKHINKNSKINKIATKNEQNEQNEQNEKFTCNKCHKEYNDRSGLWRHKKKCNNDINNIINNTTILTNENITTMFFELIKSNQELQKQMIEVCKNSQITNNNTINNTMTNCNNKTFNLQVFLNETCKNAMNLSEFIENMTVELPDLENMGKLGYVEGVSSIIIKNLKALEITQRPIHCTDEKRETVMIKENNVWFKEGDDRVNLRKIISTVISKNLFLLAEYQEKYPDCNTYDSHRSDEYTKIIMETATNQVEKKKEKIFRIIAREVVIDKSIL
jgi:ribosomal protein L37AE/L43A